MFFSPNAPGTTEQPTFPHHSFLTFTLFTILQLHKLSSVAR